VAVGKRLKGKNMASISEQETMEKLGEAKITAEIIFCM
jgi:hypothetical protein